MARRRRLERKQPPGAIRAAVSYVSVLLGDPAQGLQAERLGEELVEPRGQG